MRTPSIFRPLNERDFARLWLGQVVSNAGDWVNYVALTALVWDLTGSAWMIAVLRACHAIPILIVGPFAGVFVDRWNRKTTLIVVDVVRAGLVLLFPFVRDVGTILAITIVFNIVATLFDPAKNALIPKIVGGRNLLEANSLSSITRNMAMVVGPALGGVLLAGAGTAAAFYFDSASFVFSAVAIASMAISGSMASRAEERASPKKDLEEGLRFATSHRDVRATLVLEVAQSAGWGCVSILVIVVAQEVLKGGSVEYGLLLGSTGLGALAGALTVGIFGNRWRRAKLFPMAFFVMSIAIAMVAESRVLLAACFGYFVAGAGRLTIEVAATTLYHRSVPDELRGRVFALRHTVTHVSVLLANQAAGLVTDAATVEPVLLGSSALLLTSGLAAALILPRYEPAAEKA